MRKVTIEQMEQIAPLYEGWQETMIWSCLQGIMGEVWCGEEETPRWAGIMIGDFCFLAGEPAEEAVRSLPERADSAVLLMVPDSQDWYPLIEKLHGDRCEKLVRYAFQKTEAGFQRERLEKWSRELPEGYRMEQIGRELFCRLGKESWSRDFCSQYDGYEQFARLGLGFAALTEDGEPVAGASSYTVYKNGLEIEIDTKEEYRRKGLARACAARLIIACLDRGIYPSWDAANTASAALAVQLGYLPEGEYVAYGIECEKNSKMQIDKSEYLEK